MEEERREPVIGRREKDLYAVWDKRIRDALLFAWGSIGFFYELLLREDRDPIILIAAGALMGVPLILSATERRGNRDSDA